MCTITLNAIINELNALVDSLQQLWRQLSGPCMLPYTVCLLAVMGTSAKQALLAQFFLMQWSTILATSPFAGRL